MKKSARKPGQTVKNKALDRIKNQVAAKKEKVSENDSGFLRNSLAKYRELYDLSPTSYFTLNKEGKIVEANLSSAILLGTERSGLMNAGFRDFIPDSSKKVFEEFFNKVFSINVKISCEIKLTNDFNPALFVHIDGMAIEQGATCLLVVADITERKNSETALLNLNNQLKRRANELVISNEELERFAYVASHDLQEPLRMVSSFMQLLRKNYEAGLDEKARHYIAYAIDGADRMRSLIKDLLEYSRVGTNTKDVFEETDMNSIVREIKELFEKEHTKNDPDINAVSLPVIYANKSHMLQLFQNLVSNAIKYQSKARPVINIGFEELKDHYQFSVADNGIGIDPQHLNQVFILFHRLHANEEYSGTGIGLAICKKIIDRHGGDIWVQSQPGKGSTFYFTIKKSLNH